MVTPALMQARQLPSALGAGRLGPVSGLMDQNMTAAGIEQLRKTADDFLKEQQASRNSIDLYRQKAEAAEAQCLKLGSDIAKEQNENARLTARVKGTEHHIRDILAQIDEAKGMHNLLLQSLGEANDNIQTVDQQRERLSHAFEERFKLCQELTEGMAALKAKHHGEVQLHKCQMSAAEDAHANLQNEADARTSRIEALIKQLQQLQVAKEEQAGDFKKDAAALQAINISQGRRIEELDAEIKHAFADLERNEKTCQDLQAKAESLAAQLDHALQHIQDLEGSLHAKSVELEEAHLAHKQAVDALQGVIAEKEDSVSELTDQLNQLEATKAAEQDKHAEELAKLGKQMESRQEEWKSEKAKMDGVAMEADKKHQQLADRTALELDKLQSSAKQEVARAQAAVKELQTQLETVDKELSGVKQQKDDLTAAQETSAAQHQAQLAEAAEEKQQLGKQLEELQCKHDAAIKKAEQDLAAKSDELEEMRNAKETAAAATAMEKKTVNKLQADITSLQSEKEAIKAQAAADQERTVRESTESAQRSIIMQRAQYEAEIGTLKNRLDHEKAMSEQRQETSAAKAESLRAELAERAAMIAHLEEELQQKEHLLQQISVAAAPVTATLPVVPSPKHPHPGKMARLPRRTPQRLMEASKGAHYPMQSDEGYSDESGGRMGAQPEVDCMPCGNDCAEPIRPSPGRKLATKSPREQAKQCPVMREPAQPAYEERLPFLSHDDLPTEDERNYAPPQRLQARRPGRACHKARSGKAEAMAALARNASKKNSIFSTMSAHSMGSDDERAASYGAVDKAPAGYVNISVGRYARQPQTRKRSRLFGTVATDIFGKASMDPYSFGV